MFRIGLLFIFSLLTAFTAASLAGTISENSSTQPYVTPHQTHGEQTPLVVIYTLSACPHCQEAKEYLTSKKIPFSIREVDTDAEHMDALMKIYDSMGVPEQKRGVPLLVIGNRIRIQGFNMDKLHSALKEVTAHQQ